MHLRSLNTIRVFEAVGRLSSFRLAAAELNVTPGAVSKQIKQLEDELGFVLFDRGAATTLTEIGRRYLDAIGPPLQSIVDATARLRAADEAQPLRIWVSPFVMRRWLVSRLPAFRARMPGTGLILSAHSDKRQLPAACDVGIQRGQGQWPGYRSTLLFPISLVPVCSPGYLRDRPAPHSFSDLKEHVILENLARPDEWPIWSRAAGGEGLPAPATISFTSSDTVYQAAIEGAGIAIGRTDFIQQQLADGTLVLAADIVAATAEGYYLLVPADRPMTDMARQFQRWLVRAAKDDAKLSPPR